MDMDQRTKIWVEAVVSFSRTPVYILMDVEDCSVKQAPLTAAKLLDEQGYIPADEVLIVIPAQDEAKVNLVPMRPNEDRSTVLTRTSIFAFSVIPESVQEKLDAAIKNLDEEAKRASGNIVTPNQVPKDFISKAGEMNKVIRGDFGK